MKVLLLEDDEELADALVDALRDAGIVVDRVGTLADADLQLSVTEYDCAVLDRRVPDGDAVTLVARLRERGDTVPILLLTARSLVSDRVTGFDAGADDYLVKPFAFAELLARLRALGRRRDSMRPAEIRVRDLVLDVPRHRLTRGGVRLAPTPKEFQVLEVLLDDPGAVVTREELLDRAWDELASPGSNVVDVLIGQLRRRLGEPDLIETVRGVGYRIRA